MAQKSGASFQKRQKERKRQEKQKMKRERKIEAKKDKIDAKSRGDGEGLDIGDISPENEEFSSNPDEETNE